MTRNRHEYTSVQIAWLRENRSNLLLADLVKQFNAQFGTALSKSAMNGTCKRNKIKSGGNGQFEKGMVPYNKGRKIGIHPNQVLFKKGHKPRNMVPVGSERWKDDGYLWVKISDPGVWRQKHRVLWEAKHGPIDKDMRLIFKDGDRSNFAEDNFELVSAAELLRLCKNNYLQQPEAFKPAVMTLSKLQVKIFEKSKQSREGSPCSP